MARSVREERRDLAKAARRQGKTWVAVADVLRAKWPELTPRAALRMAHCWTQQDVAGAWRQRFDGRAPEGKEVSRWEVWPATSGVRPSLDTLDKLAQLYECSISDLLTDISDYRNRDPNSPALPQPTAERLAVSPATQASLEAPRASPDEAAEELRERLLSAALVDDRAVALLGAQADRIREVDRLFGARVAESQLRGHLDALDQLRRFAISPKQREPVADLYADAATLAGWQSLDLGDFQRAWTYYEAAKQSAREVNPPTALAHAVAEQAYVLVDLDNAADALHLAEHATSIAGTAVPDLLLSWLAAVLGEVHATLGNDADCRRAFDKAASLLPVGAHDPAMPFLVLDQVHLARWRGNALAKLGDSTAIDDLRRALAGLEPTFTRARAGLHVDIAHALCRRSSNSPGGWGFVHGIHHLGVQVIHHPGGGGQRRGVHQLGSLTT